MEINEFKNLQKNIIEELEKESPKVKYKEPKIKIWYGCFAFDRIDNRICLKCVFGSKFYKEHNESCALYEKR